MRSTIRADNRRLSDAQVRPRNEIRMDLVRKNDATEFTVQVNICGKRRVKAK
jgi:hypothetical protein